MAKYTFLVMLTAAAFSCFYFAIVLFVWSPIPAEYWVRESISIKTSIAHRMKSPKIVLLGGSATLFGVDAAQVQAHLGLPTVNMGLHAGMRLDRLLSIGTEVARPGDLVVLTLEPSYYRCDTLRWSPWQLRNALAWDSLHFSGLPLLKRIRIAFDAVTPRFDLLLDKLASKLYSAMFPGHFAVRTAALAPAHVIYQRYISGKLRRPNFSYSAYNIDANGTMQHNKGAEYSGPERSALEPADICPERRSALRGFVERLAGRGVRTVFAHTPYLIDQVPAAGWQRAEARFKQDIETLGADVLDSRKTLFLPRSAFFNTALHLNEAGRQDRTATLIKDLRRVSSVN